MDKAGHLFLGAVLGVILILITHFYLGWFDFNNIVKIIMMITIIYVYSLLPDIDTKSGTIVWTFIPLGLMSMAWGYYFQSSMFMIGGFSLVAVTFIAAQFFPHRGYTHSILFGLVVSVPWIYLHYEYAVLAFICYMSHMFGDQEYFKLI